MVTKEEMARSLNCAEYGREVDTEQERIMKESRLCAVFGASDDLMELRGFYHEEIGAYGGTTMKFDKDGPMSNLCDDENCPYFLKRVKAATKFVQAKWCEKEGYSWLIESNIPYAPFEIYEDGEPFCRGIVFSVEDIEPKGGDPREGNKEGRLQG